MNGPKSCRRPVVSLSHASKSYRVNRPLGGLHIPKSISQQQFIQNLAADRVHYGELENRKDDIVFFSF